MSASEFSPISEVSHVGLMMHSASARFQLLFPKFHMNSTRRFSYAMRFLISLSQIGTAFSFDVVVPLSRRLPIADGLLQPEPVGRFENSQLSTLSLQPGHAGSIRSIHHSIVFMSR